MSEICSTNSILFSQKLKGNLVLVRNQSDFIVTKMSDQWQEFRCTCTGEEVGQNKVSSVDLGDLLKTWTENIDFQFKPERRRRIPQDRRAEQYLQQAAAETGKNCAVISEG